MIGRAISIFIISCVGSLAAFETGSTLPRPDLVSANKFSLRKVELDPDTRVVIFFYSASWCAPCKSIGEQLKKSHTTLETNIPGLELVTYSLDNSPGTRADYLRKSQFPWKALAPQTLAHAPWKTSIAGGTPQFQAFEVSQQTLTALGAPGPADDAINTAIQFLSKH